MPTPCKQRRAATVRLNVGGTLFETTAETLTPEYFDSVISGRIGHAVDGSGAFFIDRDGDLFAILLQWLRTYDRPCQRALSRYGDALLEECNFFGEPALPQIIRGELAPSFYLKPADKAVLQKEEEASQDTTLFEKELLIDVHSAVTNTLDRTQLEQPLLLDKAPRPSLVGDFEAFYSRLNTFSAGVVAELKGIPSLVFAGGAVLAALTAGQSNDIDIFSLATQQMPRQGSARSTPPFSGFTRRERSKGVSWRRGVRAPSLST